MSLRPENPRAAKAATIRRKLKRAGRVARSRSGMRQLQPSVAELDKLWSKCIRARDGKCRRCGGTGRLQAAHIRSRRFWSTRWVMWNGVTLDGCHLWAHHEPLAFASWVRDNLEPEAVRSIERASMDRTPRSVDRALVLLELQQEAKRLGVSL